MPKYFPICLEIGNLPCLVVGGGAVGLRKARTLLDHQGKVTVVDPEPSASLERLGRQGRIILRRRSYRTSDLRGMRLVFVATNDEKLNRRVAREACRHGLLVNVADAPALCNFIVPAMIRRGRLLLAISTSGACPAYSKHLRRELERRFDRAHGGYIEMLAGLRRRIFSLVRDPRRAVRLLERLLDEDLLTVLRRKGRRAAETRARSLVTRWLERRRRQSETLPNPR